MFNYPAIDNHAYPLFKEEHRRSLSFEGAIEDVIHSLPGCRAARKLVELYGLDPSANLEGVKSHRDTLEFDQLCDMDMQKLGIQCLLLNDGIEGVHGK